jgi:addiction module HigA family antidote
MQLKNVHPGEILLEEFLLPLDISQNRLANDIGVPPRRINEIVHGKRSVTADTDLRLSRALGTSEGFWLGLQADYDLEEKKVSLKDKLVKIKSLIKPDTIIDRHASCKKIFKNADNIFRKIKMNIYGISRK